MVIYRKFALIKSVFVRCCTQINLIHGQTNMRKSVHMLHEEKQLVNYRFSGLKLLLFKESVVPQCSSDACICSSVENVELVLMPANGVPDGKTMYWLCKIFSGVCARENGKIQGHYLLTSPSPFFK